MSSSASSSVIGTGKGILKSGNLVKQGVTRKSWKKRFFVLYPELLVYYSSTVIDKSTYKGDIPLNNVLAVEATLPPTKKGTSAFGNILGREFYFIILIPGRTYLLRSDKENEVREWIVSLRLAVDNLQKKLRPGVPAASEEDPSTEGVSSNKTQKKVQIAKVDSNSSSAYQPSPSTSSASMRPAAAAARNSSYTTDEDALAPKDDRKKDREMKELSEQMNKLEAHIVSKKQLDKVKELASRDLADDPTASQAIVTHFTKLGESQRTQFEGVIEKGAPVRRKKAEEEVKKERELERLKEEKNVLESVLSKRDDLKKKQELLVITKTKFEEKKRETVKRDEERMSLEKRISEKKERERSEVERKEKEKEQQRESERARAKEKEEEEQRELERQAEQEEVKRESEVSSPYHQHQDEEEEEREVVEENEEEKELNVADLLALPEEEVIERVRALTVKISEVEQSVRLSQSTENETEKEEEITDLHNISASQLDQLDEILMDMEKDAVFFHPPDSTTGGGAGAGGGGGGGGEVHTPLDEALATLLSPYEMESRAQELIEQRNQEEMVRKQTIRHMLQMTVGEAEAEEHLRKEEEKRKQLEQEYEMTVRQFRANTCVKVDSSLATLSDDEDEDAEEEDDETVHDDDDSEISTSIINTTTTTTATPSVINEEMTEAVHHEEEVTAAEDVMKAEAELKVDFAMPSPRLDSTSSKDEKLIPRVDRMRSKAMGGNQTRVSRFNDQPVKTDQRTLLSDNKKAEGVHFEVKSNQNDHHHHHHHHHQQTGGPSSSSVSPALTSVLPKKAAAPATSKPRPPPRNAKGKPARDRMDADVNMNVDVSELASKSDHAPLSCATKDRPLKKGGRPPARRKVNIDGTREKFHHPALKKDDPPTKPPERSPSPSPSPATYTTDMTSDVGGASTRSEAPPPSTNMVALFPKNFDPSAVKLKKTAPTDDLKNTNRKGSKSQIYVKPQFDPSAILKPVNTKVNPDPSGKLPVSAENSPRGAQPVNPFKEMAKVAVNPKNQNTTSGAAPKSAPPPVPPSKSSSTSQSIIVPPSPVKASSPPSTPKPNDDLKLTAESDLEKEKEEKEKEEEVKLDHFVADNSTPCDPTPTPTPTPTSPSPASSPIPTTAPTPTPTPTPTTTPSASASASASASTPPSTSPSPAALKPVESKSSHNLKATPKAGSYNSRPISSITPASAASPKPTPTSPSAPALRDVSPGKHFPTPAAAPTKPTPIPPKRAASPTPSQPPSSQPPATLSAVKASVKAGGAAAIIQKFQQKN